MRHRISTPSDVIKISHLLPREIEQVDDTLIIGAGITHWQLSTSQTVLTHLPSLADCASQVGDPQIRHRGTVGGSVSVNDPAADYPAACLALGARIHTNKRVIDSESFFLNTCLTALEKDEIVLQVEFKKTQKAAFLKILEPAARWPLVGVFVSLLAEGPRVAVIGAHKQGVFRQREMERALSKAFTAEAIVGISTSATDFRSTLSGGGTLYRANLVDVLTARAIDKANGVNT